ncbi:hypothetical protein DSO57_1016648 [Entomophthora muscae]|uniref:Uncharacterized protein n=1 Tax=Entomophthora muscae TaxID=34485 RepID=A0ACC2U2P8_9FUNG|nr:hypothetical protein DSO57_1016648 [Entomophthora muscae]
MEFPDSSTSRDPRFEDNRLNTFAELLTSLRNSRSGAAEIGSEITRRPNLRRSLVGNIRDYGASMNRVSQPNRFQNLTGQSGEKTVIIIAERTGGFIWDQQAVLHAISPFQRASYHGLFNSFSSRQQQILSARGEDVEVVDLFLSDSENVPVALTTSHDAAQEVNVTRIEQNRNTGKPIASKSELGKLKIKSKKASRFTKTINRT